MACRGESASFMSKSAENAPNWVADWIEQQRKKIEQSGSSPESANGFSAFFQSLTNAVQGSSPGFASPGVVQGFGPPLGLMREHEQAWRELSEAQARYRQVEIELFAQLNAVQLEALALLEQRVANKAVKEMRELYDLWVECGEEVYARRVRSDVYCKTQAEFANAASELRLRQQVIIERALRMFDLPTRSEINSVHRQLRELKEKMSALTTVKSVSTEKPSRADKSKVQTTRRKATIRRKPK